MKLKIIAVVMVLGCMYAPAYAQGTAALQGHSFLGGTQATTSGLQSTNYLNGIIPHATITVYLTGTTTLATIYADGSSMPLSNPFTSNTVGSVNPGGWIFWAAVNQGYDVIASGGIAPNTYANPVTLCADCYPGMSFTGTGISLQTNGTPNASQGTLNHVDSSTVKWVNPSGGIEQASVQVAGGFQMFQPDPLGTQSVVVPFTVATNFLDGAGPCFATSDTTSGKVGFNSTGSNLGCEAPPGPNVTWSAAVLPSYITPANVTAIYAVGTVGFTGGAQVLNLKCFGPPSNSQVLMNGGSDTGVQKPYSAQLTWATGAGLGSISCIANVAANTGGAINPTIMNIPSIALRVYYTGPAPPASTALNITSPLYINTALNALGVAAINLGANGDGGVIGILPVANGGTGTATPGLVQGTNVTITGTWPNQTINSSGGGGSGTVTSFAAPSGSWPSWLVPTVTNSTTTPSLAVAASAIPNSALQNASTTVNGTTCTLGSTCTISGGGSPGGSTGAIQYNNAGAFGGVNLTGLVYGNGSSAPTAATITQVGSALYDATGNNFLIANATPTTGWPLPSSIVNDIMFGNGAGHNLGNYTPINTTGTAASGSTTLTIASATGIVNFMSVAGAGIPAGTTVVALAGTTVTLSAATTAALSATPVAFTPGPTGSSIGMGFNALGSMVAGNGMTAYGAGAFGAYVTDGTGPEDGNSVAVGPYAGSGELGAGCAFGPLFESDFVGNKTLGIGCGSQDSQFMGNHMYGFYGSLDSSFIGGEMGTTTAGVFIVPNRVQATGDGIFDPSRSGHTDIPPGTYNVSNTNIYGSISGQSLYNTHDNNIFGTNSMSGGSSTNTAIFNDVFGNNLLANCTSCSYNVVAGSPDSGAHNTAGALTTGTMSVIAGAGAGSSLTTATGSTIAGAGAAQAATTSAITAFGEFSCQNATGSGNVCIGPFAGYRITSGSGNIIISANNATGSGPNGAFSGDTVTGNAAGLDNASSNSYYGATSGNRTTASLGTNSAYGNNEFSGTGTGAEQYDAFFGAGSNCNGCSRSISLGYQANIGAVAHATQIDSGTNSTANTVQYQTLPIASLAAFSVSGCGTAGSLTGSGLAGTFTAGATSCTPVITTGVTAPHGFICSAHDWTTPADVLNQVSATTTTATFAASTVVSGDTIAFECKSY